MLRWFFQLLMILAGLITSWFVARDALNFDTIQMVVTVLLFTVMVLIIAFWPALKNWFRHVIK